LQPIRPRVLSNRMISGVEEKSNKLRSDVKRERRIFQKGAISSLLVVLIQMRKFLALLGILQ